MDESMFQQFMKMAGLRFQAHPWHGIEIGPEAPEVVTAYIEIIPSDTVKYEVDKPSGHLKVDRPQKFSNIVPALYGFIPQTYCKEEVGKYCMEKTGRTGIIGIGSATTTCVRRTGGRSVAGTRKSFHARWARSQSASGAICAARGSMSTP